MSAGKGDSPRNCFTQSFRDNWDRIFAKEKASNPAKNTPEIAAERNRKNSNAHQRPHR